MNINGITPFFITCFSTLIIGIILYFFCKKNTNDEFTLKNSNRKNKLYNSLKNRALIFIFMSSFLIIFTIILLIFGKS